MAIGSGRRALKEPPSPKPREAGLSRALRLSLSPRREARWMKSKTIIAPIFFALLFVAAAQAKESEFTIKSPDGKIAVAVRTGEHLSYSVNFRGKFVLGKSTMGITVDGEDLGQHAMFSGKSETKTINETYRTRGVHTTALNHCNVTVIPLMSGHAKWQLEVRVFNDGVAYRYRVPGSGTHRINGESSEWNVPVGSILWHQNEDNRAYEARYYPDIVGQLSKGLKLMAPATLKFPGDAGYGMMTEANFVFYSDMALQAAGESSFRALFHYDWAG